MIRTIIPIRVQHDLPKKLTMVDVYIFWPCYFFLGRLRCKLERRCANDDVWSWCCYMDQLLPLTQGRGDAATAIASGVAFALGGFHHSNWSYPMSHLEAGKRVTKRLKGVPKWGSKRTHTHTHTSTSMILNAYTALSLQWFCYTPGMTKRRWVDMSIVRSSSPRTQLEDGKHVLPWRSRVEIRQWQCWMTSFMWWVERLRIRMDTQLLWWMWRWGAWRKKMKDHETLARLENDNVFFFFFKFLKFCCARCA